MSTISERGRGSAWAVLLAAGAAAAQITDFQGGKLSLQVEGNMSPFALASNTGARGAMSNVTSLYPSASSLYGNPAALGRLSGLSVQTDFFLPGLGLGISSERTKLLRNNLRAPIKEFLDADPNHVARPVFPDVDMGLYQSTNMSGFSVAYGAPGVTLATGIQQPFRGSLDFALGGFRLGLGMPEEEGNPASDSIKVLLSADAFARLSAELNDFSLGAAGSPRPGLRLGAAYHRYTIDLLLEAGAHVDGILQRAGQESYFNSAGANYHDDLNAAGYGQLRGSAHGLRLGADWQFMRHLGVDAMLSLTEIMALEGTVSGYFNTLPALDFGGEQIFAPSQMNPTKLTLTTRVKSTLRDVKVNLPWEGALSLHSDWENFRINLDYSYFLRGLSLEFTTLDSVTAFDTTTKDVYKARSGADSVRVHRDKQKFQLGLSQQFALGIQAYQVFLQLGGIFYSVSNQDVVSEAAAYRPAFLPFLPTMNMGYFFPVGPNFTATVSLVAFPVSLFKTSVEYRY